MEEFKISLGVELDSDVSSSIQTQINNLHTKPIKLKIDTDSVKNKLGTIKKQIKALNDIKLDLKTKDLNITPTVNLSKIEKSFDSLVSSINEIKASLGSLDKDSGMNSLLTSINEISGALSKVGSQFESLANTINTKDFSVNIGVTTGAKNPTSINALYGDVAKRDTIPQLKQQAHQLESVLKDYYKVADGYSAVTKLISKTSILSDTGIDIFSLFNDLNDSSASLKTQMGAYRDYIKLIEKASKIKGIDLSSVTSGFSKSADKLVQDTQKILTGEKQVEDTMTQLKGIFGGTNNISFEGVSTQLDTVISKLTEMVEIVRSLSSGISVDGLTDSFNNLSSSIQSLIKNCTTVKTSLNTGFNGSINSVNSVAKTLDDLDKINLNSTKEQIDNMRLAMEHFGFDEVAIGKAVDEIKEMGIIVTDITTKLRDDNSISLSIKGVDDFDNVVTAIKNVRQVMQEGEKVPSISTDIITKQKIDTYTEAQKTNDAYKEVIATVKEIGTIKEKIARLDENKNAEEITDLTQQLNKANERYINLRQSFNQKFDVGQLVGIEETNKKFDDKISNINAGKRDKSATKEIQQEAKKINDAYKEVIETVKKIGSIESQIVGLDTTKDVNQIENLTNQLDRLYKKYDDLIQSFGRKFSKEQLVGINEGFKQADDEISNINAKNLDKSIVKEIEEEAKRINDAYKELLDISKQIGNLELKIGGLDSDVNKNEIAELTRQLNDFREVYQQLFITSQGDLSTKQLSNLATKVFETRDELARLDAKIFDMNSNRANDIKIKLDIGTFDNDMKSITDSFYTLNKKNIETINSKKEFEKAFASMYQAIKREDSSVDEIVQSYEEYEKALKKVKTQIDINTKTQKNDMGAEKLEQSQNALKSKMDVWLYRNSAAARQFGGEIEKLKMRLQSCDGVELGNIKSEFEELKRQAELAGVATDSMVDRFKKKFSEFSTYFSAATAFSYMEQGIRSMYNNVVELDTAMTNLYKVTDETDAGYNKFLTNASNNAKELGRSVSSYVEQSANWAKMGFDAFESAELARVSSIYSNVAEVDDDTAVGDIVTAMKAFGGKDAKDAMNIIDSMNQLGK